MFKAKLNPFFSGILTLLAMVYFGPFLFGGLHLLISQLIETPDWGQSLLSQSFGLMTVGLSMALLSALTAWPFALSLLTVSESRRHSPITAWSLTVLQYWARLPLLFYVFLFYQILGPRFFSGFQSLWMSHFTTHNVFTEAVAFALTLLLFPLTILPFFSDSLSVNEFYHGILISVFDFGEVGLVAIVLVFGLWLFTLPRLTLRMFDKLNELRPYQSYEAVQALGGSQWESLHLSVVQLMKSCRWALIVEQIRHCFFEGVICYSLIVYLVGQQLIGESFWQGTMSAYFIHSALDVAWNPSLIQRLAAVMLLLFFALYIVEKRLNYRGDISNDL